MKEITIKPDYLYNPDLCPCPRGGVVGCPRYRDCNACVENHHKSETSPMTACEKKALQEQEELEKAQA